MTREDDDAFLWLEEVHGERALAWVRERNAESQAVLQGQPGFAALQAELLDVLNASDRIPAVTRRGEWLYNLWQDSAHPRGLWRRTTLAEYRKGEPAWETVLDIDALAAAEGENWVWAGAACLGPAYRHAIVSLSRGGADASVQREFDCVTKAFIAGGFELPEAKSIVEWVDADTLYIGTDFGPGSLTDSGYPRVVKRWRRGTPLADAEVVFEAETSDVWATVDVDATPGHERTLFSRGTDFFHRKTFLLQGDELVPLDVPDDASVSFLRDTLFVQIRSDWQPGGARFVAGSLLAADAARYLRGERELQALFTPTPTRSLAGYSCTRDHVLLNVLDNVTSRLEQWRKGADGVFGGGPVDAPYPGTLGVAGLHDPLLADDPLAEHYLLGYTDFLTPDTLSLAHAGAAAPPEPLKAAPALFDATGMRTEQRFATSRDGTRVPYFVIWPAGVDAARAKRDALPTLLYGYGGFELPLLPAYAATFGRAWHARGGVRVVANIRGGGEFGPAWHRSAQREHKQRSYDDFIAVAEDLIARGITSPRRLGIWGGSNGGLLVGAVFTQRPELFNAVVCSVPLLDMRRYHHLLAGASWMAEYGNPDDAADWAFIGRYSPYQNVRAGTAYPRVLFTTSTRDDRVHPGHARKMAAKMRAQGHDLLYHENIEGGHGGAADNAQRAHLLALEFAFLWLQLGGAAPQPQDVLDFWFGAPGTAAHGRQRAEWFRKDEAFDATIRTRFGPLIEHALAGGLREWSAAGPRAALARILVLDQFTRNAFRHTARAFAGDALALAAAQALVDAGDDMALNAVERMFAYLPFEHAEGMAQQDESVRLYGRLAADAPELSTIVDYAERHRAIVARFGRFPHRNAALGRASTAEELAFLQTPGSSF